MDTQLVVSEEIIQAGTALRAGGLVAFPTETVYGLGADACNDEAVREVFTAKGRPSFNPLIVHVSGIEVALDVGIFNGAALDLMDAFWPGPLTLVVERRTAAGISPLVTAGLETIAVRAPMHPIAQALLKESGLKLAAPSANRSGRVSPTTASHVRDEAFEGVQLILDGGASVVGIESTIVQICREGVRLLRPGSISVPEIEAVIGANVLTDLNSSQKPLAPGMLQSHYAPRATLRLGAEFARPDEGVIAFGGDAPVGGAHYYNLSENGDLTEAAQRLYAGLRLLDELGVNGIAVATIPVIGVGCAINDRLLRAASPRTLIEFGEGVMDLDG